MKSIYRMDYDSDAGHWDILEDKITMSSLLGQPFPIKTSGYICSARDTQIAMSLVEMLNTYGLNP